MFTNSAIICKNIYFANNSLTLSFQSDFYTTPNATELCLLRGGPQRPRGAAPTGTTNMLSQQRLGKGAAILEHATGKQQGDPLDKLRGATASLSRLAETSVSG